MSAGLIQLIITQRVLKTYNKEGTKYHYLGNNQKDHNKCQPSVSSDRLIVMHTPQV